MKILLPVDGSDYTRRMLDYLAAHKDLLGPGHSYAAFTAIPKVPAHAAHFIDQATLQDHYREQAELVLQPVRAVAAQQGWQIECLHGAGRAAELIADLATQQHCDLIVMGTHGKGALGSMLLGSVVSGVLARSRVPVLLVR